MASIDPSSKQFSPIEQQNYAVLKWLPKVRRVLVSKAKMFTQGKNVPMVTRGPRVEHKLANSINTKTRKDFGEIDTISFSFERHGVFVHKGVGRGYKMSSGVVTRTAKGPVTILRKPVDWFNPVLDGYIPELADNIAKLNANAVLNIARAKIH
jgi:hypothetical protein